MTTVVVQAHPLRESYSGALLERVCAGLTGAADTYEVFRLGEGERPDVSALDGVERLVVIYPTWWGGQPAVLVSWIQEMLQTPGSLSSVRRLVGVSSHGSSRLLNHLQGQWGRANLSKRMLSACAEGATFEWLPFYKIDRQPQSAIDDFLQIVEDFFNNAALPAR